MLLSLLVKIVVTEIGERGKMAYQASAERDLASCWIFE